jgi:hypothetical protein
MELVDQKKLSSLHNNADFNELMQDRIKKILMICSSYDAFNLEEDGQIEEQITREYIDLNISNPPAFEWVTNTSEAMKRLMKDSTYDLIITMFNIQDPEIFNLSGFLRKRKEHIPIVMLTQFSKEIFKRIKQLDSHSFDYVFSWNGNADLIVAIIKLIEDKKNADADIRSAGVQSILLIEDSVVYYSTYLPAIYKLILKQSAEFLKEALNDEQQKLMKRARPKILLATNYDDAVNIYKKYKDNLLGVISDIGFVMHKDDPPEKENLEAGLKLAAMLKKNNPYLPILLQSNQSSLMEKSKKIGCGFILKYSLTLLMELSEYISEEFVFGDFVFRDLNTKELIGRAKNLKEMQYLINDIPEDVLAYHTSRNRISKWMFSRGLFPIAKEIQELKIEDFGNMEEVRKFISEKIKDYRMILGQGIVAKFTPETYHRYVWFAKMGEGSMGGKARGLAFVNKILNKYAMNTKYPGIKVMIPRSIVIATDYFDEFITENGLQYVINSDITDNELLSEFVSSRLPETLSRQLKTYIETVRKPLAVRSSSKLEDTHFQPFAGIYSTYMIPVTENKDQMMRLLEKAIKSVYASIYFKESRAYIHTTGNLLGEEKMAIVIQDICGSEDGGYYFPTLSGVARSLNYYPLEDEDQKDGIVNMAYGLGKLIVDGGTGLRFSPKYPKKILQLSSSQMILNDTQKKMYALDLKPEEFKTSLNNSINIKEFSIQEASRFHTLKYVASTWDIHNDRLVPNSEDMKGQKVITFANILQYGQIPVARILKDLIDICEKELRTPVEIEFAVNLDVAKGLDKIFDVLQVRPISDITEEDEEYEINDESIKASLVYSEKAMGRGRINGITNILYVKGKDFDNTRTMEIVNEINAVNIKMTKDKQSYVLIGPGRWGSSDPFLGIPVKWNNISEAKVIVEASLPDFQIDPSQGTHFFQNITSLGIGYLTVNSSIDMGCFDEATLNSMPASHEGKFIRVVKFDSPLTVYINGKNNKGIILCQKK